MKKVNIEPIMFSRKGAGRIDENITIDLLEYVTPRSAEAIDPYTCVLYSEANYSVRRNKRYNLRCYRHIHGRGQQITISAIKRIDTFRAVSVAVVGL